jgi:hypothetical protein
MISISGVLTIGGLVWQIWSGDASDTGVRLSFKLTGFSKVRRREGVKAVQDRVVKHALDWLTPGRREWTVDCEGLKAYFECLKDCGWLKGKVQIEPQWEEDWETGLDNTQYHGWLAFELTPEIVEEARIMARIEELPPGIAESYQAFVQNHPDPAKVCFIMMQFGTTTRHNEIVQGIKSILVSHGISGLRADDRQYHDDLLGNLLTYMHGCGFGISVFERLEDDDFNPNVSLELGYMLGLGKPVCLLKDSTLRTLNTDLMGRLYKSFDPQAPARTMAPELEQWLKDKGLL